MGERWRGGGMDGDEGREGRGRVREREARERGKGERM
jgi:hypothetical protein